MAMAGQGISQGLGPIHRGCLMSKPTSARHRALTGHSFRSLPHPFHPHSWLPLNYTSGEICEMTNTGDLPETFLLVSLTGLIHKQVEVVCPSSWQLLGFGSALAAGGAGGPAVAAGSSIQSVVHPLPAGWLRPWAPSSVNT